MVQKHLGEWGPRGPALYHDLSKSPEHLQLLSLHCTRPSSLGQGEPVRRLDNANGPILHRAGGPFVFHGMILQVLQSPLKIDFIGLSFLFEIGGDLVTVARGIHLGCSLTRIEPLFFGLDQFIWSNVVSPRLRADMA